MGVTEGPFAPEDGTFAQVPVRHCGVTESVLEAVAEEVPVAFEFNGISHAVMFASPADLDDFALGFALTEGIVTQPSEVFDIDVRRDPIGITLSLRIASERFMLLKDRRRSLTGRTGCGLCGTESLDQAVRALQPVTSGYRLAHAQLKEAFRALRQHQHLMSMTGAVHAAGWVGSGGALVLAREDIGRHNALDKVLGAAIRMGLDLRDGAALITSRASFEMVHKAASMGVGLVAAISAPTALAVRMAHDLDVTLIGFVRDEEYALYTHPWRLAACDSGREDAP